MSTIMHCICLPLCIGYYCHILTGASAMYLQIPDQIQRIIRNVIGVDLISRLQLHPQLRIVDSLCNVYKYLQGNCSDKISCMVPRFFDVKHPEPIHGINRLNKNRK